MFKRFLTNVAWLVGMQLVVAGLIYSPLVYPAGEVEKMQAMASCVLMVTVVMGVLISGPRRFIAAVATVSMSIALVGPIAADIDITQMLGPQQHALALLMLASCVVYDAVFIGMLLLFDREPMRRVADTS